MDKTLFSLVRRLWSHFSCRRHHQFFWVMLLMLISTLTEVLSLGALLPFIGILIAPQQVFDSPFISNLAYDFRITSADQLKLPLTMLFVFAVLLGGAIRMFLTWVSTRLAYAVGSDLSVEIYHRTLYQPFEIHAARNSSNIIGAITSKVHRIVFQLLMPLLVLSSSILLMVAITASFLVIDPVVAMVVTAGFGSSYMLISWFTRRLLYQNSQRISYEETQAIKALQEGLGGIRDVLLDGVQSTYCDIYRNAYVALNRAQAGNSFVSASPRYIMEALGMVLIAVLAYLLSSEPGGVATALPVLAALALGAQRLLPALQQSYYSWATISGCKASLAEILELLEQPLPDNELCEIGSPMLFQTAIQIDSMDFRYSVDLPLVLKGLNLVIRKGWRVGFVGTTGSGKSTLLDLLMGLLSPTEGRLLVDDQLIIDSNVREWQKNIAHVPQNIYLADTTIAENIAFGVQRKNINMELVRLATSQAQLTEFIQSMSDGFDTFVGERGIRLSGGQRQRIGIARALYKKASVLVFDEATSALDSATEKSVMDAIEGLNRNLTVIMVAHRLTTVKNCDIIFELQQGQIVAQGTYDQLLQSSLSFRRMATSVV